MKGNLQNADYFRKRQTKKWTICKYISDIVIWYLRMIRKDDKKSLVWYNFKVTLCRKNRGLR